MIGEINNIKDVSDFFHDLFKEGVNAHPDEDFNNYVNVETGIQTYTTYEASIRNTLMEQSFAICARFNQDIYSVMQEIFLVETGLDKYIPLPSQEYFSE